MADNFEVWWTFVQLPGNDGHATDTAPDGAGDTRWGWTYPTWCEAQPSVGGLFTDAAAFSAMSQADAKALALAWFWNRQYAPSLPAGVDIALIDWTWTSGGAVESVQTNLGLPVSGILDIRTATAMNSIPTAKLISNIGSWRSGYYQQIGLASKFPGLMTRTLDCQMIASIFGSV